MVSHRVCLLQAHVFGTRHGRCADREKRKSKAQSPGCIRARYGMGTPDSGGTGRKQAMRAMIFQGFQNAFSAKALSCGSGKKKRNPFPASTEKQDVNHGLNDKSEKPWYPMRVDGGKRKRRPRQRTLKAEQQSGKAINREENIPSLFTKQAREPASDEQRYSSWV